MDFLLDPNLAYLILLAGLALAFLAIVTPGTGVLELAAFFCLLLAVYSAYHLSVHWWALALLALSLVPLALAIRRPSQTLYLALSILLLIAGSVFIFPGRGGLIAVNPLLASVTSIIGGVSLWLILRKAMEALAQQPVHNIDALIGQTGDAKTKIHKSGSAYIGSEMWSARSNDEIPAGSHVRVVARDGFVLIVEKLNSSNQSKE